MRVREVVAVAVDDDRGLDAEVSDRFSRAPHLLLLKQSPDGLDLRIEIVVNPALNTRSSGANAAAHLVQEADPVALIVRGIGYHAREALEALGVDVITTAEATARMALQAYWRARRMPIPAIPV